MWSILSFQAVIPFQINYIVLLAKKRLKNAYFSKFLFSKLIFKEKKLTVALETRPEE